MSGRTIRNSSPPNRPRTSLWRSTARSRLPIADRISVSAQVSRAIVHRLELIDVEHHDRQRRPRPAGPAKLGLDHLHDVAAVEALRQRVGEGVLACLGEQLHVADGDSQQRRGGVQQARVRSSIASPSFSTPMTPRGRPAATMAKQR